MIQTKSYYVNPNTRGLTSNIKNAIIKDEKAYSESMSQNLLEPIEDEMLWEKPIKFSMNSFVDRKNNAIGIVKGQYITVNDGYVLTVKPHGVEVWREDGQYYGEAYDKARRIADSLDSLLRNACGNLKNVAHSTEEYERYAKGLEETMSYLGIDTSKDFTVNGMKYSKNKDGLYESEVNITAKIAQEKMEANKRTYNFADDTTRKRTDYISSYYLRTVSDEVKAAWNETLKETNINPFQYRFTSTLTKLSVELDFQTDGEDDNILGNTRESCLEAVNNILAEIENRSADATEKEMGYLKQEKEFYTKLAAKLKK